MLENFFWKKKDISKEEVDKATKKAFDSLDKEKSSDFFNLLDEENPLKREIKKNFAITNDDNLREDISLSYLKKKDFSEEDLRTKLDNNMQKVDNSLSTMKEKMMNDIIDINEKIFRLKDKFENLKKDDPLYKKTEKELDSLIYIHEQLYQKLEHLFKDWNIGNTVKKEISEKN